MSITSTLQIFLGFFITQNKAFVYITQKKNTKTQIFWVWKHKPKIDFGFSDNPKYTIGYKYLGPK